MTGFEGLNEGETNEDQNEREAKNVDDGLNEDQNEREAKNVDDGLNKGETNENKKDQTWNCIWAYYWMILDKLLLEY